MKMTTRAMALMLGLSALLSLAACNPSEEGGTTTVPDTTTTTAEETTTGNAPVVTAPPRYDYFSVAVAPDVDFGEANYKSMSLTLSSDLQITDEDVTAYVDQIRYQRRVIEGDGSKVTDKPLRWGDLAYIYYKGEIDGVAFEGGSNWEDASPYGLGLGSGSFIPGFEEGLVGVIPAEATKESPVAVQVTFPENYGGELSGKDAIFYVAVEYAVLYTLPAYDRAFVETALGYKGQKDFYAGDAAFLEEFEAYLKSYLENQKSAELQGAKEDAIWSYLIESATCKELPEDEVSYYYNIYERDLREYYDYYKSADSTFESKYPTVDAFAAVYLELDKDTDWRTEFRNHAEEMVCKDMIVHAIAESEGFETVTDAEYREELDYWAEYYQGYMSAEEIVASMGEATIRESALAIKVVNWLMERTTFTFEE